MKPIAGTDGCRAAHMGYFVSGRMKVVADDGEEMEYGRANSQFWRPAMMLGLSGASHAW